MTTIPIIKDLKVSRSFLSARALGGVIAENYDLDSEVSCKLFSKLLRTQDNDHYLVRAGEQRFVARIYQNGDKLGRQESDYLFELDWLKFLHENDRPVAYPIRRKDGHLLGAIQAPEGIRYFALFSFAAGTTMSLSDEEQIVRCGAEMARIHLASNTYETAYTRHSMDLEFLVDRSVERIQRNWDEDDVDNLDTLLTLAQESRDTIEALLNNQESTPDSWGPIGGDFHSVNTHFDNGGNLTFFNFDLCGYGWRAYDIATFLLNTNIMHSSVDLTEAFFAGYYSVRPLSSNEHEAIEPFLTIRRIWLTGMFSMSDGLAGHTFIAPARG